MHTAAKNKLNSQQIKGEKYKSVLCPTSSAYVPQSRNSARTQYTKCIYLGSARALHRNNKFKN